MIMPNIQMPVKCQQCRSENVKFKWSLTTLVSWLGKLLGVQTVKIYEKECAECGREF
jgi:predicted nucleic-acid-binding Zn-ribbon protein